MADANKIELDVQARTEEALAALRSFIDQGQQALARLQAIGEEGLPLNVSQAQASLASLLAEARELEAQVERGERVEIDGSAAISVLQRVGAQIKTIEGELDRVAATAAADLQKVGSDVAGVAAGSAAKLRAEFEPLREIGAQIASDLAPAEAALERLRQEEEAAAEEAARLANPWSEALGRVDRDLATAAAAAESFETKASTSTRGAARAAATLQVQIERLREEIAELAAQGVDTAPQVAALGRVEAAYQRGIASAGKLRAAQEEAGDQLRLSTIRAGELQGQFSSMEEVVGLISPKLAPLTGTLLGVQAGLSIVQSVINEAVTSGAELAETFGADKKAAEEFGKKLEDHLSLNPLRQLNGLLRETRDGFKEGLRQFLEYTDTSDSVIANLSNQALGLQAATRDVRHLAEEYKNLAGVALDTTGKSLEEIERDLDRVRQQQDLLIASGRTLVQQAQGLTVEILGNKVALEERSAAILAATDYILRQNQLTAEGGAAWVKVVDEQIAAQRRLGLDTAALEDQRRDLIDKTTQALIKEEVQIRAVGDRSEETTRRFVTAVNEQLAALDSLGRGTAKTERERQYLVDSVTEAFRRREAALLQDGRLTAAQAEAFRSEIEKEIEAIERLGQSADGLKALLKSFEQLQRAAQLDSLSVGLQRLREFANEARNGGRITTEQADKIIDEYRRIVAEINTLPEAERKEYEGRLREASKFYSQFYRYTTEYIENAKRQEEAIRSAVDAELQAYQRRTAAIKQAITDIREAAKGLPDSHKDVPQQSASELKGSIEEKQKELSDLSNKFLQSADDINRIDQLKEEISKLTGSLRELGQGATAAGGDFADLGQEGQAAARQIETSLTSLLQGSQEFQQAFRRLPVEFQDAVRQLVTGFVSDLHNGLIRSDEDVQQFSEKFVGLLRDGGVLTSGLAAQLQSLAGGAGAAGGEIDHMFDGLLQNTPAVVQQYQQIVDQILKVLGVTKQYTVAVDQQGNVTLKAADGTAALASASTQLAAAGSQVAASQQQVGVSVKEASTEVQGASEGYIRAHKAQQDLAESAGQVASSQQEAGSAAQQAGNDITDAAGRGGKLKQEYVEITKGAHEAGEGIHKSGEQAQEAAGGIQKAADSAQSLGTNVKAASDAAAQGASSMDSWGSSAQGAVDSAKGLTPAAKEVGEAFSGAKEPIAAVAKGLQDVAKSGADEALSKISEALKDSATSAGELVDKSKELATELDEQKKKYDDLADSIRKCREEWKGAKEDLAAMNKVLSESVNLCRQLAQCQAGAGG